MKSLEPGIRPLAGLKGAETLAYAGGQAGSVGLLIQHGADVHAVSTTGDTALHIAAAQGSTAAIEALLTQVALSST